MEKQSDINKRDSFVFYRSFFEAIDTLSQKKRLLAYEAIIKYALNEEVVENLPKGVLTILTMAKPNLKANNRKFKEKTMNKKQKDNSIFEDEIREKVRLPQKKYVAKMSTDFTKNGQDHSDFESLLDEM